MKRTPLARSGRIKYKPRKARVGKTGTVRLDAAGMAKLREAVYDRAMGLCEMPRGKRVCGRWAGWLSGQLAHYPKSRGAGAGDTEAETRWSCAACHRTVSD